MMKAYGLHWAGAVNRVHLVGYALMFASQNAHIFGVPLKNLEIFEIF